MPVVLIYMMARSGRFEQVSFQSLDGEMAGREGPARSTVEVKSMVTYRVTTNTPHRCRVYKRNCTISYGTGTSTNGLPDDRRNKINKKLLSPCSAGGFLGVIETGMLG